MQLATGARIGPYEIAGLLGAGGMGEVYRARDTKLGRDVALKILPPSFAADSGRRARFRRESQLLASLNHPNIGAIYGAEESDGIIALVLELVDGPTIAERLARGPIPVYETLRIATQIADALEAAHDKGIVHRDLKPANITTTGDGRVKVLDFGLAKAIDPTLDSASTADSPTLTAVASHPGLILGTAAYAAPEQARGQASDKRVDIWAFGCVVYEMLTARRIFNKSTVLDTLAAVVSSDIDWSPLPPETPPALRRLLTRCVERDPRHRLHDIADARIELEEIGKTIAGGLPAATTRDARRDVNRWLASAGWLAAALMMAALIGIAALYPRRSLPESSPHRATLMLPAGMTLSSGSAANRLALSPDGRRLAFAAADTPSSRPMIWVRPLDALVAQPLAGTEGGDAPFWSPDSRTIGFFAAGKIKRIDATGGPTQTVCDYPTNTTPTGATWSREDVILFAVTARPAGIQRVSASGGTPVAVTTPDQARGEFRHARPFFLPDGRRFLFVAGGSIEQRNAAGTRSLGIRVGSLDSHEYVQLLSDGLRAEYANGHVVFLRDTTLMAQPLDMRTLELKGTPARVAEQVFSGLGGAGLSGTFSISETGSLVYQIGLPGGRRRRLAWRNRTGEQVGLIGDQADYRRLALSPDGASALVSVIDTGVNTLDTWIVDLSRGVRTRLTRGPADDQAIWSPDGRQVVFAAQRADRQGLFVKAANGAGAETSLLIDRDYKSPQSWSADGRFILYIRTPARDDSRNNTAGPPRSWELWALPLVGERKPFMVRQTVAFNARLSPDDRWIAFTSAESGRNEVYVTPFPNAGATWVVSTAGGTEPRWRRDGREIYYQALDNRLMAATISASSSSFHVREVKPLFDFLSPSYDASADGQRFLISTIVDDPRAEPLTLVAGWPAALNR